MVGNRCNEQNVANDVGNYEDEGVLQKEWVQCMNNENCGAWMHAD